MESSSSGNPSTDTIKRLVSDVKQIVLNPLEDQGIYYYHSESNMLKGSAMIIGPKDTPYAYGYYFFDFTFPINYPHSPPVVTYLTNDGKTRFNPNYYRSGKVCLSMLNTWRGPQWSGCNTITSILLTLCSVLNDEPFLNEPGITKYHKHYNDYMISLAFSNINISVIGVLSNTKINNIEKIKKKFNKQINETFKKNFNDIKKIVNYNKKNINNKIYTVPFYKMTTNVDYEKLLNELTKIKKELI